MRFELHESALATHQGAMDEGHHPDRGTLEDRVARLENAGPGRGNTVLDKALRYLPVFAVSNLLVSIPAFLISIGVAYFTFIQADATEKMQIASVWPRLAYSTGNLTDDGRPQISFTVGNQGVGPALLQGMEVSYEGQPFTDADALVQSCCGEGKDWPALITSRINGMVIRPGDDIRFLRLNEVDADPAVFEKFNTKRFNVRVKLCYCSVFEDCWVTDSQVIGIEAVEQCPTDWAQYEIPKSSRPSR